jgi:hypothetical protein
MFKFLRERRQRKVLTLCEAELERTQKAYAKFVNTPGDLATRAALLEQATAEDLTEHPIIKRLEFLQRLLAGLATAIEDSAIPAFIEEARALGLTETDGIRLLIEHQRMQMLAAHGPEVIERTATGHTVFLRCQVEHKRQTGTLEVRNDGLTFVSEAALEIPWSTVVHVAKTRYNDGEAIAIQEGKRRTATKFVFFGRGSEYACEVILQTWKRSRPDPIPGISPGRSGPSPSTLGTLPTNGPGGEVGGMADTRDWWTEIQGLKQTRQYADLERVLLELVDSEEHDSHTMGDGVAPAAYWDLAVLYRKLKRTADEIAILERFEKQTHAPGAMPRKLLERLMKVSGRTIPLPPKPVYDPRPRPRQHNFMAVVGESYRQDVLRAALETHGHAENAVMATLECEPENQADANAVAVKVGGQLVGYLERDVAERFRPFIAVSPTPVICKATLRGGTEDKPNIGIVVDFSPVYLLRDDPAL